jgi:hypothetical protein
VVGGDCFADQQGAWAGIAKLQDCIAKCESCDRCIFVSFSKRFDDCSWYATCDATQTEIPGQPAGAGDEFHSVLVKSSGLKASPPLSAKSSGLKASPPPSPSAMPQRSQLSPNKIPIPIYHPSVFIFGVTYRGREDLTRAADRTWGSVGLPVVWYSDRPIAGVKYVVTIPSAFDVPYARLALRWAWIFMDVS